MERTKLVTARLSKYWTQEQAAEQIGVDLNTLCRWEKGKSKPYAYNVQRLCDIYGMSAWELGIGKNVAEDEEPFQTIAINNPLAALKDDLTMRLLALIVTNHHGSSKEVKRLQARITMIMEEFDMNKDQQNYQITRREALTRMAMLPLMAFGLSELGSVMRHPVEDILTQCAAGITACQHLSQGQSEDIALAMSALSAYLPTLKAIVKDSSQHGKAAAALTSQGLLIQATLELHRSGPKRAAGYARQAVTYAKESKDVSLELIVLKRLAWIYSCDNLIKHSLDAVTEAQHIMDQATVPLSNVIKCSVYGGVAKYHARNSKNDEAQAALNKANIYALTDTTDDFAYIDYNFSNKIMDDGLTYYYQADYEKALNAFSQVIDPETLTLKIPASSERIRVEIINHQTLASLKLPKAKKDKTFSLNLWRKGIEGAKALCSEQRFAESLRAFDIIEGLWGDDVDVKGLRELTEHW